MAPLMEDSATREFSFHTKSEFNPSWSCHFKWPIKIDNIVLFNRNNSAFYSRIGCLRITVLSIDGSLKTIFQQSNPVFTGRSENSPLRIDFGGITCHGFTIQALNKIKNPLHLQSIEIFQQSQSRNNKAFDCKVGTKYYTCSFAQTGFGDKLLSLAISSTILECLGFRFSGIDPACLDVKSRLSNHLESDLEIYQRLGVDKLIAPNEFMGNVLRIKLDDSIREQSFEQFLRTATHSIRVAAQGRHYSSIQLYVAPGQANQYLITHGHNHDFFKSEPVTALKRVVNMQHKTEEKGKLNIVIHARLGDVANLEIGNDKWLIPWVCFSKKEIVTFTQKEIQAHERFDRLALICQLANRIDQSKKRSKIHLTILSDGIERTSSFMERELSSIISSLDTCSEVLKASKASIEGINFVLSGIASICDAALVGESSDLFISATKALINADFVISTNGHYCFGMSQLSEKNQVMAMAYMDRTKRNPADTTIYWSGDHEADIAQIMDIIETIA